MRVRVAAVAVWALTAACGARTPLLLGGASDDDSSADDASAPVDGSPDAIVVPDCVSAGAKLVYFVTNTTPIQLYSIDPASGTAVEVGALDCAMSDVPNAFSMAVDRKGNAYLLTTDLGSPAQGAMWQVSTTTAHCEPVLDYARGQLGFSVFGMAFATNGAGSSSETLYIEGAADLGSVAAFGTLDTSTWRVTYVGANEPPIQRGQLTGTGDGRLFELYYTAVNQMNPLSFDSVDVTTGDVFTSSTSAVTMTNGIGFSVAWWGGGAYGFLENTAPLPEAVPLGHWPGNFTLPPDVVIVAAGVSTCAPP